jgi:TRAP-type mannitol/chloroaromatic compound transport system substrate-binding protein
MRLKFWRLKFWLGVVSCLAALAIPASAQDKKVRLQIGAAFPSTTAILGPAQQRTVDMLKIMSAGSIDARLYEPGALVPANQYFDAVSNGSLDAAWTAAAFFTGKNIAFAVYSTIPFGPEAGEFLAWKHYGGGRELQEELFKAYKIVAIDCGLISPEASGWFRKEIKTLEDLKGLKMRFLGLGAGVMQKLGVATQLLQAGEIFQALQLGTIDAAEFSMPAMDATLGFHQVAKFYYFPGWHQMATITQLFLTEAKWAEMSPTQKEIVKRSCEAQMLNQLADGEASQFKAINDLKAKGVQIKFWDKQFLDVFHEKWLEVAKEQSDKSPEFKKALDSLQAFRADYKIWKDHGYLK